MHRKYLRNRTTRHVARWCLAIMQASYACAIGLMASIVGVMTSAYSIFFNARYVCGSTPLLQTAASELDAWFAGALVQFNLPLAMAGTPFQQRVWSALLAIPYGQTTSYTDVARAAGCSNGVRAVAQAIGANSICIIVPCHRVIGLDGALTGFAAGVSIKRFLLRIEGVDV